jgi:hypothetical protein
MAVVAELIPVVEMVFPVDDEAVARVLDFEKAFVEVVLSVRVAFAAVEKGLPDKVYAVGTAIDLVDKVHFAGSWLAEKVLVDRVHFVGTVFAVDLIVAEIVAGGKDRTMAVDKEFVLVDKVHSGTTYDLIAAHTVVDPQMVAVECEQKVLVDKVHFVGSWLAEKVLVDRVHFVGTVFAVDSIVAEVVAGGKDRTTAVEKEFVAEFQNKLGVVAKHICLDFHMEERSVSPEDQAAGHT